VLERLSCTCLTLRTWSVMAVLRALPSYVPALEIPEGTFSIVARA